MLEVMNFIGTIAFGISGYIIAKTHKVDILGLYLIAFITAFAGGIIRDISVNETPFIFQNNYFYILITLIIYIGYKTRTLSEKTIESDLFTFFDSIGLVSFSITGALISMEHNLSLFGTMFLALITATGGGVIRDILLNRNVSLLYEDIYGLLALIIGFIIYFIGVSNLVIFFIFIIFSSIRIYIKRKKLHLTKI